MWTKDDIRFMKRCLKLAERARGNTSPNPMVGAVIVRDGKILGEGYHHYAGAPHAEIEAIRDAGHSDLSGATMYVSLEPCCFSSRTPPCSEALIDHKIQKVIAAVLDPNPRVAGGGIAQLQNAGIETAVGLFEDEARRLNEIFFHFMQTGLPFTISKAGMSLDGKIATDTRISKWITSLEARTDAHRLRQRVDAVAVGIETVLADDPELTVRHIKPLRKQPVRIVFDRHLRIPLTARLVTSCTRKGKSGGLSTIVVTAADAPLYKITALREHNVEVILVPDHEGQRLHLPIAFKMLAERDITSILLEGGPTIAARALHDNLISKIVYYIAPKLIGGATAPGPIGGRSFPTPNEACHLVDMSLNFLGDTIRVEASVKEDSNPCSPD